MSLILTKEPVEAVGGSTFCAFNSGNNKIVFEFQRKDLTFTGGDFLLTPSSGSLGVLSLVSLTGLQDGDYIYLNCSAYPAGLYEVSSASVAGFVLLDLTYTSGGAAGDYINVNAIRPNYYAELQVTVDSVTYTHRSTPDNEGVIKADISGILRSLLTTKDDNPFTIGPLLAREYIDLELLKTFNIKYLEKYTGSSDTGTVLSRDFYAVNSAKHIGENPNLIKYAFFVEDDQDTTFEILSLFKTIVFFGFYPFEWAYLMGEAVSLGNSQFNYKVYDLNRATSSNYHNQATESGKGLHRVNMFSDFDPTTSFDLFSRPLWDLDYYVDSSPSKEKTQRFRWDQNCYKNPIYIKWLNDLGGFSYWLFSSNTSTDIDNRGGQEVSANFENVLEAAEKEYTIPGRSAEIATLSADNLPLTEIEAWKDFLRQENVWQLRAKLWSDSFTLSNKGAGVVTVTNEEPHNLKTGDLIKFWFDNTYRGTEYTVNILDEYVFEITSSYSTPSAVIHWRKVIEDTDWILCRKENQNAPIRNDRSAFSLSFDLIKPSYTRKLK